MMHPCSPRYDCLALILCIGVLLGGMTALFCLIGTVIGTMNHLLDKEYRDILGWLGLGGLALFALCTNIGIVCIICGYAKPETQQAKEVK